MKFKIIILILTLITLGACKYNSMQGDSIYTNISNVNSKKDFEGYIKRRIPNILYFETEGKVTFIPYKKGDYIRKGQVLARLDGIVYKIKKEKFNLNDEINYNLIIAPYDGYIDDIYVSQNSYIKSREPILSIYKTDKTEAETLVEAQYINKINLNNKVKVKYKDTIYEAKISNILKNDDDYLIELKFDNLYKELKGGSNVKVELDFN